MLKTKEDKKVFVPFHLLTSGILMNVTIISAKMVFNSPSSVWVTMKKKNQNKIIFVYVFCSLPVMTFMYYFVWEKNLPVTKTGRGRTT